MLTKVAKLQVKQKMWDKAKGNVQGGLYFGLKFCFHTSILQGQVKRRVPDVETLFLTFPEL